MPLSKPFYAGAVYCDGKKSSEKGFEVGAEENESVEIMFKTSESNQQENSLRNEGSKEELADSEPKSHEGIISATNTDSDVKIVKAMAAYNSNLKDNGCQENLNTIPEAEAEKSENIQIPAESQEKVEGPLLQLSDEAAQSIELEQFHSAMDLLDQTAEYFDSACKTEVKRKSIMKDIRDCDSILDISPRDIPTIFRRMKARMTLGQYEGVLEDMAALSFLKGSAYDTKSSLEDEKKYLGIIAQLQTDKNIIHPMPRAHFAIPSALAIFKNDPVSNLWRNEKSLAFLNLNAQLFHAGSTGEATSIPERGYALALRHLGTEEFVLILEDLNEELANVNSSNVPMALLIRGTLQHLIGYGDLAFKDYDLVIAHHHATNEQSSAAWIKKGILSAELGNLPTSFMCFRKAEFLTPLNADVYFAHAKILLLRNRDAFAALIQIEKACDLAPDFELYSHWKLYIRIRLASQRHAMEGIENALLEFEPPIGPSDCPEILRVDMIALTWMGHHAEAHSKLEALNGLEPDDPRIYLGRLLLHEMIYNDVEKRAFWFLEDTFLSYGRSAQIHEDVGHYAFGVELMEASADCFKNAFSLAPSRDEAIRLAKLHKTAEIASRVVKRLGTTVPNHGIKFAEFKQKGLGGSLSAPMN